MGSPDLGERAPRCASVPDKFCYFYGWNIVAVGILCTSLGSHIGSVFINTLTMARVYDDFFDLGYQRSTVSFCWLCGTLAAAMATPVLGSALDRFGARVCMPLVLLMLASGMVTLGISSTLYTLPPAFFLIRAASLGAINPYISGTLGQWFAAKRGKAVATVGVVSQIITNMMIAPVFQFLLNTVGWRQTHLVCAIVPVGVALLAALVMCHTPESVGMVPDAKQDKAGQMYTGAEGEDSDADGEDRKSLLGSEEDDDADDIDSPRTPRTPRGTPIREGFSFTRKQALRTMPVYLLSVDKFFAAIIGAGCSQVLLQVLRENGADESVDIASHVMLPNGVAQATLPIVIGILRDCGVKPKYLVAVSSAMIAIAPLTATQIRGPGLAVVYGLNFGSVWGLKTTMSGFLYADYYGRKHVGSIQALDSMCGIAGTAVGPLFIQTMREIFGSYTPVLYTLTLMPACCAVLNLVLLRKPPLPPEVLKHANKESSIYSA